MEFTVRPVQSNISKGDPLKVVPATKSGERDRRRKKRDRRENVRTGVVVSLSVNKKDRRRQGDRRRNRA
jgi:hypothetical protein